jgi:hypothetical protein
VVKPQSVELQLLRAELPGKERLVFVKPSPSDGPAPLGRYDEFGLPSTYFAWVPPQAVTLVARERSATVRSLEVLAWDQAPAATAGVVDMRKLRRLRVGWSVWTLTPSARRP